MKKVFMSLLCAAVVCCILSGCDSSDYKKACNYLKNGDYEGAIGIFSALGDYKDSAEQMKAAKQAMAYDVAMELFDSADYDAAITAFGELGDYRDSQDKLTVSKYQKACELYLQEQFEQAKKIFSEISTYKDSSEYIDKAEKKIFADQLLNSDIYEQAYELSKELYNRSTSYCEWNYDAESQTIVVDITNYDFTSVDDFDEASYVDIQGMDILMKGLNEYSASLREMFMSYDFDVSIEVNNHDSNGECHFTSLNGQATYSAYDINELYGNFFSDIYEKIVNSVTSEQYQVAYDRWVDFCGDNAYDDTLYKDLHYYNVYAKVLKDISDNCVISYSSINALQECPDDFLDVYSKLKELNEIINSVSGTYGPVSNGNREYTLELSRFHAVIKCKDVLLGTDFGFNNTYYSSPEDFEYHIVNGVVEQITFGGTKVLNEYARSGFDIKLLNGGATVVRNSGTKTEEQLGTFNLQ